MLPCVQNGPVCGGRDRERNVDGCYLLGASAGEEEQKSHSVKLQ